LHRSLLRETSVVTLTYHASLAGKVIRSLYVFDKTHGHSTTPLGQCAHGSISSGTRRSFRSVLRRSPSFACRHSRSCSAHSRCPSSQPAPSHAAPRLPSPHASPRRGIHLPPRYSTSAGSCRVGTSAEDVIHVPAFPPILSVPRTEEVLSGRALAVRRGVI
jgi:hypothetical protein